MPSPVRTISLDAARRLAVHAQALDRRPARANRPELLEIVRRIGLLQLDTVNVVARSHYLVMLARAGEYDPADLDALLYPERRLFEGWAHAACMIPVEHYPYFAPLIQAERQNEARRWTRLGDDPQSVLDEVLGRITAEGPLRSADFADPRAQRGTWWDWKPAKIALEVLFNQGYLAIDRRVNFHRYYDLAERVLPASAEPPQLTVDDWRRWAAAESVRRLGVATRLQTADYYRMKRTPLRPVLDELVAREVLLPVAVEGWREPAYLAAEDLPLVDEAASGGLKAGVTALLTPFDNLMWNRHRVRDLFGFHYTLELYASTAGQGRRFGYYVLSILRNGELIGRLDPKAERRQGRLRLRAVYLEPGVALDDGLLTDLAGSLHEFAAFHGCPEVLVERSEPAALGPMLSERLQGSTGP